MGIPYYFASLVRSHKTVVQACRTKLEVDILAIDFNCLIHRYLDDRNPIESILAAIAKILNDICHVRKKVYIGADGLAPYAKIVNQRQRRFKQVVEESIFDRTQISPGTPYMTELMVAVKARFPDVHVSGTEDPGEGEHKLFNWLKNIPTQDRRSIVIYGLDADLILLSLMQKELSNPHSMWLLREAQEFKDMSPDRSGFCTMSIWKLSELLPLPLDQYIRLCTLCFGNDFMPNLAMFSLREDGHTRAIHLYKECGKPDITTEPGLMVFLRHCATKEVSILKDRVEKRGMPFEKSIVSGDNTQIEERVAVHLLDGCRSMEKVSQAFWKTYFWSVRYFVTNDPVDWSWVYPYPEAPLLSTLVRYPIYFYIETVPRTYSIQDQLQTILPTKSLAKTVYKSKYVDEYYNEETETRIPWMKRFAWETDPYISIPWSPSGKLTLTKRFLPK